MRFVFIGLFLLLSLGAYLFAFPPSGVQQVAPEEKTVREATTSPQGGEDVLVVRAIDGDTVELENGEHVRYIGIDTPESVHPDKPPECFGAESAARNRELVEGKRAVLVRDVSDRDKYGRLLRYVYVDDVFVNELLVKEGYAQVTTYPPDVAYVEEYLEAQRMAREAKLGLWAGCATGVSDPNAPSSQCSIKGNISMEGEKIYHLPACEYYGRTVITESKGERWFCSENEAQAGGWRKALNCY